MTTRTALLLLALAAAAAAAPYGASTPRCSTECPVAAAKLSFLPGKTYSYTYTGKSKVELKGVEGGLVETKWEAQVLLTMLGPCDVAISFKGCKVDGETGLPGADKLEMYPLVVAVTDGRVQKVCTHPDDDTWAINIKKGVASVMQISVPSLSTTNSGLNFTETDVVGTCPTRYDVEPAGAKVMVRKEKDHRQCQDQYPTPDEIHLPYLKGPLPIQESRSICRQEIESGIISSVVCEDKKVVRPSYGAYKFVEAKQESTLRLTSSDVAAPDTISRITQGQLVSRSLRYDYHTPKKDPSLVPQLEETLKYLCEITKDGVQADAAVQVNKAVHLMRHIPEQGFKEIYAKVRSKQICPEHNKVKSLYFDMIPFVHEPESVEVMVKELVEKRATGPLAALYSAALYLVPRPDERAIQALEPLFTAREAHLPSARLAAGSMVNAYCRHNPQCYEEEPVRSLLRAVTQKIEEDISSSSNEESQKEALSAFKSLGNMGVMTQEAAEVVLRYIQNENKKVNIRVTAAQAFRRAKCERSVTQQLVQYILRPGMNTEVRIASYLAAIPCVNYGDLQAIVTKISYEENTQVRGFILSHLLNLQQSDAPEKERLRYLLTNIVIPQDFEADLRKYSRNLDLSYFSPSLGLGAELESNLIYAPGSFIPRSLGLNLTAALDGTGIPINIGEIGARLEGLEPIIARLFGPASYFKTSSYSKMFHDLVSFIQKEWSTIQQELESSMRQRRSIDYSTLKSIFSKLYGPQSGTVQADVFARFLGQEINYVSLSKRLQDIDTDRIVEVIMQYLIESLGTIENMNLDSARAAQLEANYYFPTIQGSPLKMKLEATAVAGMKVETNLNGIFSGQSARGATFKFLPSFSVETCGFIGYDGYISKSGLRMNTTVSSSNGLAVRASGQGNNELQVDIDIPEKMEIIRVQSETFLMKQKKGQPATKVLPPSIQDNRIQKKSCFTAVESVLGLKMCYDVDVPDVFQANSLPLGRPTFATLSINKTESSIRGYKVAVTAATESQAKKYGLKVSVTGSPSPKETEVEIKVKKESESYTTEVKLQSSATQGEAKVILTNRPDYKSFQTDFSFKTNAIEFTKAMKVDLKISPAGDGKKYEMDIFSSPSRRISQESIIFTGELMHSYRSPWVVVDISAKTKNILMQYIPFSFEVAGDLKYYSGIPIPMRLRKLELETGIDTWKIKSFLRKSGESSQSANYESALQVAHEGQELIDIQTEFLLEGTPAVDYKEQLLVKAKVGQAEYKMHQLIEYQQTRTAVNLQLTRSSDNLKLIEIVAEKDLQQIKFVFQVQPLEYMAPIKVAASGERQGQDYRTEAVVKYGSQILVQLQGPVTFINSPSLTKLGVDFKVNNVYQFESSLEFEGGKQAFLMNIKKQEEVLTTLEFNLKITPSQGPSLQARAYLPALFDIKGEVSISETVIHASTNTLVLPRSSSPRRIKAFMDINFENKQGQVMMLWNADQDPSKKIAIDAIIVPESGSTAQATVHVKTTVLEHTYHANIKVVAPFLWQQYRQRNSITMEMETPERRKWMVQVGIQDQGENSASAELTFRSVNNNNYHLTSDLRWQPLDGPFCFEAVASIQYVSPQNSHAQFAVHVKHHWSPEQHVIQFKMEASTPNTQTPLMIQFSMENKDYSYITKLLSEVSGEKTMFLWHLDTYPEGGVKVIDIAFDAKAIRDVVKVLDQMLGSRGGPLMVTSAFENERSGYRWRYSKPSPDTHSVKFQFPSRTVEAEATYSPYKAGIKVYPNRAASEAKYEVTGEYIQSHWGGSPRYEGRFSHPKLPRDMIGVMEYTSSGSGHQGSFQLDVFPDTADKITGSLISVLKANNTVAIDADLSSRVLQVKPKVTVEASWAAHTAAFNFTFQKTPSSPESFKVYAKYDRISNSSAAVTFQLSTHGRPAVDVSGVVEPRQGPHCDGYALLANARTSLLGSFIANSTVCRPAFLEVALKKQNSHDVYKAKLGLQLPYKAEVSISKTNTLETRNKFIALIGVRLASPRLLKIDFEYKPEEMRAIKDFVEEEASRMTEAALSWTERVYSEVERQAHQAGVPFPAPEIRTLAQEIKNDIIRIFEDLIYNDLLPEWEAAMQIVRGPTATFLKEAGYQTLLSMAQVQRQWAMYVLEQITYLRQLFNPAINEFTKAAMEAVQWVETGEEPEMVRRLMEEMQRTAIYQLLHTQVIEPIKETYPQQFQATMEVLAKVTDTFRQDLLMIQQKVWASPTLRSIILRIIDMIQEETLQPTVEWWVSQMVQYTFYAAPEPGMYRVGVQIPLFRPIYSLTQVVNMTLQSPPSLTEKVLMSVEETFPVSLRKVQETYYAWMPANLSSIVQPFNRSALVVGETEIITFDGVVLRTPRSPCKVLLSSVPGVTSVYMSHPQPSERPEITFQAGATKATIKPNMEVDVNGRQVHGKQALRDLVVEVTSSSVTLVSPMMGVQWLKEERVLMVNVSRWAFNHTKGLLGSYDNERANDRMMSNGRNASSLHELVASWQESPNCPTPAISPVNPALVPTKESVLCDILFFRMRPCAPVVSPKPFKQRCWVDPHPYEAARSYESFCRSHGVKFPLIIF